MRRTAEVRVLLVEDGDIGRLGRTAVLAAAGHEVVARTWAEVAERSSGPTEIGLAEAYDAVTVVLTPNRSSWDRYPTVRSLSTLSSLGSFRSGPVAIVERGVSTNPLLALRLAAVGVQRLVETCAVQSVGDMDRVVGDPGVGVAARPSEGALLGAGVMPGADPEAVLAWVQERLSGPSGQQYRQAFEPTTKQNACGLTRRQALEVRERLAELGRIQPNSSAFGGGPSVNRYLARWNEVVRVVNMARGLEGLEVDGPPASGDAGPPASGDAGRPVEGLCSVA